MCAESSITESIGDVVSRVSDTVVADVAVVTANDLVRPVASRILLHFYGIVCLVFVAEAAIGSTTIG